MVPACGDGLADEACFLEVFGVLALGEFVGGEAVAVCGKGVLDGGLVVGGGEPGFCVDVPLDVGDLHVDGFGDEEVDAVAEVFEEALWD